MRVTVNSIETNTEQKKVTLSCLNSSIFENFSELELDEQFEVQEIQFEFDLNEKAQISYLMKVCLSNRKGKIEKTTMQSLIDGLLGKTIYLNAAFIKKAA